MATAEERDARMKILTDIDEMVVDEDEEDPIKYDSIDFILQNLRIAHDDIFHDESQTLAARRAVANTTVLQMCFYLGCILKPFTIRRRVPIVAVFGGEGFIGSQLVQKLIDFGLGKFLLLYSRNMLNKSHWDEVGVKVVSSFDHLTEADGKIDIVICCADISAFPHIAHVLHPVINKATAFITSTLGLQRRRVFNLLKTSCVLRTFVEHADAIKRSFNDLDTKSFLKATQNVKQALTLNIPIESDFVGSRLSQEAYAADLIARRCSDIRQLIFVIENNYVVKGVTPVKARNFAIRMVLGNSVMDDHEPATLLPQMKQKNESMLQIEYSLEGMHGILLAKFQEQLSKYIRVVDLPDLIELAVRVDAPAPEATDNLLANITLQQEGGESLQDSNDVIDMFENSTNDDNSIGSISSDEPITSRRSSINEKLGPAPVQAPALKKVLEAKQKEKEEAKKGMESLHAEIHKRKMFLEAQKKVLYDDMYNSEHPAMHSDDLICSVFDQDTVSEAALIALPPKVQMLMAIIEEEEKGDNYDDSNDILNAFEGFLQLPPMVSLTLTIADLGDAKENFVSTMPNDDELANDMMISLSNKSPSPSKRRHDHLKTVPGAHPVLVDTFSRKGFVSAHRDRVNEELDEFELTGGITVVHEGVEEDNEAKAPSTQSSPRISPKPPVSRVDSIDATAMSSRATPKPPPLTKSSSKRLSKVGSSRGFAAGNDNTGDAKSSRQVSTPTTGKRQSLSTKIK